MASGASSQGAVWPLHASRSNCSDVSTRLCNKRASLLPGLLSGWLFLQRCLKKVFDRRRRSYVATKFSLKVSRCVAFWTDSVPCERGPTPKLLNVGGGGISGSTKHQTRDARETVRENEGSCYIQTLTLAWFCAQTRFTWLTLTPASLAVSAMLHPPLLRAMTRSCILVSGLRPAYRPAPLAKSMPWRCRSRRSSKSSRAIWGCKPESQKFPSWARSQYWCGLTPNSYFPAATSPSRKLFD